MDVIQDRTRSVCLSYAVRWRLPVRAYETQGKVEIMILSETVFLEKIPEYDYGQVVHGLRLNIKYNVKRSVFARKLHSAKTGVMILPHYF